MSVPKGEHAATIVYIEDNLSNLKLVQRLMVRRPGVKLISAWRGIVGLDLIRKSRPDLVLLDLHLPDISGQEILALLQADPATSSIPVIVISADATPGEIARAQAAGAKDYLTKPFEVRQFLEIVDRELPAVAVAETEPAAV
jgi:CheY-like chemotaxis protein